MVNYMKQRAAFISTGFQAGLHDSFTQRYDTAPEYDYTKGKWKN